MEWPYFLQVLFIMFIFLCGVRVLVYVGERPRKKRRV